MKNKRKIGFIALVIGVGLIGYAVHSMQRIANAKGVVNALSAPFSDNPIGRVAGKEMERKASQYDLPVMILLIGGIAFTTVGALCIFKKK